MSVQPVITQGHRLATFRRLVQEHEIDLLVLHTKDKEQQAMHGMAYSLAVELRHVGLLLL